MCQFICSNITWAKLKLLFFSLCKKRDSDQPKINHDAQIFGGRPCCLPPFLPPPIHISKNFLCEAENIWETRHAKSEWEREKKGGKCENGRRGRERKTGHSNNNIFLPNHYIQLGWVSFLATLLGSWQFLIAVALFKSRWISNSNSNNNSSSSSNSSGSISLL